MGVGGGRERKGKFQKRANRQIAGIKKKKIILFKCNFRLESNAFREERERKKMGEGEGRGGRTSSKNNDEEASRVRSRPCFKRYVES